MKSRYLLLAMAGLVLVFPVMAQIGSSSNPVSMKELILESLVQAGGESADYEAILNELEYLQTHPLDLNTVTREKLQQLSFLTDFQISSLLDYRQESGQFLSIYELAVIYGFTDEVITMMLPYVTVTEPMPGEPFRLPGIMKSDHHELTLRANRVLEEARGYSAYDSAVGEMHYPGNPWLLKVRYQVELKDFIQAGITMEKDPGEDLFQGSNRNGFDFNSAFIRLTDVQHKMSIVMGDYRLAFGQGLTLWSGAAPGKSSLPMNIVKRQDAIKAFTSADENNFFRGGAANLNWRRFTITGFFSIKNRDANITDTLADGRIRFSSFQESGYHRTRAEISDEKSVRESVFGGNIIFRNNFLKVGSTVVYYHFDKYMIAGNETRDIHDFEGNGLLNVGFDYSLTLNKVQVFGETSYGNQYWAIINGALLHVSKFASFSLLYRNYGTGYFSLHSAAFSEGSTDSNEEAFYAGLVIHPAARFKISGYADFYRFPWLKSGLSAPAAGSDYLLQLDYSPGKQVGMYLKFRHESDPEDGLPDAQIMPVRVDIKHNGLRYHISYRLGKKMILQNRIEWTRVNPLAEGASRGILFYQDVEYRFNRIPVVLDFRFAWFNTQGYASRIYAYEQDMTAGFSFSPMYDKGCRTYLLARLEFNDHLSCWLRLSNTWYFNKSSISSGYDEINAGYRNDLKLQLTWRI